MLALVVLPACDSSKDIQISELQRQVDDLLAERANLESRLAAAMSDGDRARQMALTLQQQLDDARRQMAEGMGQADLPPGWEGTATIAWIDVGSDVLFDSGRASLKKGAMEAVQQLAGTLNSEFPDRQVWVVGHTDNDPIKLTKNLWSDNLDLSLNRAATVAREFYKLGVGADRLYVAGQGEHQPKAPNDTKANKALNRRVEIIAIVKQGD
jgi:outer membrane protein OmpA-like peptidoglycan-associated protein